MKEKFCLNCNNKIVINFDGSQASIAACKRKYCNQACSRAYGKKNKKGNLQLEHVCIECNKTYFKAVSLSKNTKFCSRYCQNINQANKLSFIEIRKCVCCIKEFRITEKSKRKYCSASCASNARKSKRKNQECEFCKCIFEIRANEERRFCKRECQYAGQSSGLVEIHSGGRIGYRTDLPRIKFKSSFEADYMRYCNFIKRNIVYCTKTFNLIIDEKSRHYTPDFYHEDTDEYVETKGDRKDGLYNSNLICLQKIKDDGYNITLLKMSSFYEMLKTHDFYEKIPNLENRDYSGTKYLISN